MLWFVIGFFVGGTVGGMLMAAASVAKRSDYFGPEQLWAGAGEGTGGSETNVNLEDEFGAKSQGAEDVSRRYVLVSREG